ncbi:MAG TPA: hypothetical protein VFF57_12100 [Hanamia sp.]|nr:hypothetical protein [Hanamia sp.]
MKICTKCGKEKNESDFSKAKKGKKGFRAECIKCRNIYRRLRYKPTGNNTKFKKKIIDGDPKMQIKYCRKCGQLMVFIRERLMRGIMQYEYQCKSCEIDRKHKRWLKNKEILLPKQKAYYEKKARGMGIPKRSDHIKKTFDEKEQYKRDWERKNPEKYLASKIKHQISKTYGIEVADIPNKIIDLNLKFILLKRKIKNK